MLHYHGFLFLFRISGSFWRVYDWWRVYLLIDKFNHFFSSSGWRFYFAFGCGWPFFHWRNDRISKICLPLCISFNWGLIYRLNFLFKPTSFYVAFSLDSSTFLIIIQCLGLGSKCYMIDYIEYIRSKVWGIILIEMHVIKYVVSSTSQMECFHFYNFSMNFFYIVL